MEPSGSLALRLAAGADWNTALPLSTAGDAGQALAGQVSGGALIVQLCSLCVCVAGGAEVVAIQQQACTHSNHTGQASVHTPTQTQVHAWTQVHALMLVHTPTCSHASTNARTHACMHAHKHIYTHINTHACMYTCTHTQTHTHTHACKHSTHIHGHAACTHMDTCTKTQIHIHTHRHMHKNTDTHTHT